METGLIGGLTGIKAFKGSGDKNDVYLKLQLGKGGKELKTEVAAPVEYPLQCPTECVSNALSNAYLMPHLVPYRISHLLPYQLRI